MNLDLKLLKDLYLINHISGEEYQMITYIINYCYHIPNINIELDHYNNLFITKNTNNLGNYPCLIAHMDTVHNFNKPREIIREGNLIYAKYINSNERCGLNADDCNGIFIILNLLNELSDLKVCFTVEEEVGGVGADQALFNINFFKNVRYLIQPDRRGSSDLITVTNGYNITSDEFLEDINDLITKYSYKSEIGTFTDVGILSPELGLSGINVSCGYYNEHTIKEICHIDELLNCYNFIKDIIIKLDNNKYYDIICNKVKFFDNFDSIPCDSCTDFDCLNCKKYI